MKILLQNLFSLNVINLDFDKCFPKANNFSDIVFKIGLCHEKLGRYKEAFRIYDKLLENDSHYHDIEITLKELNKHLDHHKYYKNTQK